MEEGAEPSLYVAQLRAQFDSCDSTATGFLDRDELTELCRKLQLDAHLPLLLDTLLRGRSYARVNFEEFKSGFVSVLSRSADVSTSEDDSSYLEPVLPEEVRPKFTKGAKRYGRRSRPDSKHGASLTCGSEDSPASRTQATDSSPAGVRRAKLRRATSLESVESLKSDEETGSQKLDVQSEAPLQVEEGMGGGGDHICDPRPLNAEQLDSLLRKLDVGLDGRISIRDFQKVFFGSAPVSCSTPVRAPHRPVSLLEERLVLSTSPSLLTATVGQRVLTRLDDGSGWTSPEQVIALWTEEGIKNGRDLLQTLDFSLDERLSLLDLTLALDNELLVGGTGLQQAALISYKNEIQHLGVQVEQACRERDKVRLDLDQADQRNLNLVREVDDRHANMETLNQSRIRDLECEFRERVSALRSCAEQESEAQLEQAAHERSLQQGELQLLRTHQAQLQDELSAAAQVNSGLEAELSVVKVKLTEAEASVNKLHSDVEQLLQDKFGGLDPAGAGLNHEERFCQMVKGYELTCRELRDRNDELSSELELLKSQRTDRKSRRDGDGGAALSWTDTHTESDSDDSDMKRHTTLPVKQNIEPDDKTDEVSGPGVSIQTELALEQLTQQHNQELQELRIQLDTQVNYYERSLELMRQNMEVERKDVSQAFKLEISELEELKAQAEAQVAQLKEELDKALSQRGGGGGGGGGGGWGSEQERRMHREQAELEQNFAREIGNLVQKLSAEKEQLEAELRLKMDQEVMVVREEAELQLSQMKLQHAEGQRRLLHQLHRERQRATEQRAFWEEEKRKLGEELGALQEVERRLGQSEASVAAHRGRSLELEDDLSAARGRSSELEARLEEACAQLQESVDFLEAHEALSRRLEAEKSAMGAELDRARTREAELRAQEAELGAHEAELDSLRTDRARLIQDLKEQAMAVDTLQLRLDAVGAEPERAGAEPEPRRSGELLRDELELEREEARRLRQENRAHARITEQLSNQIVEMEGESSALREKLRLLSHKPDLKREQDPAAAGGHVWQEEAEFEEEKSKMRSRLMELEQLVLDLEEETAPTHLRTQLEALRSENSVLQERVRVLQQDVLNLEDEMDKRRRKLDEVEREHQRSREEEERLRRENSQYREEVLDLSGRNLQLSGDNAELSARLHGDQEMVRMLRERLATVAREQEEEGLTVRRLQEAASQQERERLQQQNTWTHERHLLEREVNACRDQLTRLSEAEAELSAVTLKLQWSEEDKVKLLREADDCRDKAEKLQQALLALESEAELLRSQLGAVGLEKLDRAQEVTQLRRELQEARDKEEALASSVRAAAAETEELRRRLDAQETQASVVLQGASHRLQVQNQELQQKLVALQNQRDDVDQLTQEKLKLRSKVSELEAARMQAEKQALRSDSALSAAQAQHARQLQEAEERASGREEAELLQLRLQEERRRSQRLEEELQAQQGSGTQDQYEKAAAVLQQKVELLERKLKALRSVLQEKVTELKEQTVKGAQLSSLLKDVSVENSGLMVALQRSEQQQSKAERKSAALEEKVGALHRLLRGVVHAALAT